MYFGLTRVLVCSHFLPPLSSWRWRDLLRPWWHHHQHWDDRRGLVARLVPRRLRPVSRQLRGGQRSAVMTGGTDQRFTIILLFSLHFSARPLPLWVHLRSNGGRGRGGASQTKCSEVVLKDFSAMFLLALKDLVECSHFFFLLFFKGKLCLVTQRTVELKLSGSIWLAVERFNLQFHWK